MDLKMFLNKLSKKIRQIYGKYVNCKPLQKSTYLQQVWPILHILCWAISPGRNVYKLHQEICIKPNSYNSFSFTTIIALVKLQKGLKLLIKKGL